ncbi:Leucine-rich repeat-containing protein 9 [Chytridiales sp. JEL 0842]|nr:Leucine-rich repeat-containing protein 9 [Chytridiales sp. JEL 0842]
MSLTLKPVIVLPTAPKAQRLLDDIVSNISKDYIRSWTPYVSPDPNLAIRIDGLLVGCINAVIRRCGNVDFVQLVVGKGIPILKKHATSWRVAAEKVASLKSGKHQNNLRSLPWEELDDEAIGREYNTGKLHPALGDNGGGGSSSELMYLRKVTKCILPMLFSENDCKSKIFCILMREILVCCVLKPTIDMLADADYWNQTFDKLSDQLLAEDQTITKRFFDVAVEKQDTDTILEKKMTAFYAFASPQITATQITSSFQALPNAQSSSFQDYLAHIKSCEDLADAQKLQEAALSDLKRRRAEMEGLEPDDTIEGGVSVRDLRSYVGLLLEVIRKVEKRIGQLEKQQKAKEQNIEQLFSAILSQLSLEDLISTEEGFQALLRFLSSKSPDDASMLLFYHDVNDILALHQRSQTASSEMIKHGSLQVGALPEPDKISQDTFRSVCEQYLGLSGYNPIDFSIHPDLYQKAKILQDRFCGIKASYPAITKDDVSLFDDMRKGSIGHLKTVYQCYVTQPEWSSILFSDTMKDWRESIVTRFGNTAVFESPTKPKPFSFFERSSFDSATGSASPAFTLQRQQDPHRQGGLSPTPNSDCDELSSTLTRPKLMSNAMKRKVMDNFKMIRRKQDPARPPSANLEIKLVGTGAADVNVEGLTSEGEVWDTGDEMTMTALGPFNRSSTEEAFMIPEEDAEDGASRLPEKGAGGIVEILRPKARSGGDGELLAPSPSVSSSPVRGNAGELVLKKGITPDGSPVNHGESSDAFTPTATSSFMSKPGSAFSKVKKRFSEGLEKTGSMISGGISSTSANVKKPFEKLGSMIGSGAAKLSKTRRSFSGSLIIEQSGSEYYSEKEDLSPTKSVEKLNDSNSPSPTKQKFTKKWKLKRGSRDSLRDSSNDLRKKLYDDDLFSPTSEALLESTVLSDQDASGSPLDHLCANVPVGIPKRRSKPRLSIETDRKKLWAEILPSTTSSASPKKIFFGKGRQYISASEDEKDYSEGAKSRSLDELGGHNLPDTAEFLTDSSLSEDEERWRGKVGRTGADTSKAEAERSQNPASVTLSVHEATFTTLGHQSSNMLNPISDSMVSLAGDEPATSEMMLPSLTTPRIVQLGEQLGQIKQELSILEEKIGIVEKEPPTLATKDKVRSLQLMKAGLDVEMMKLAEEKKRCTDEELENLILPNYTTINIIDVNIVETESKDYAVYIIEVHRCTKEGVESGWVVQRRYHEFVELHQSLKAKIPVVGNYDLPGKLLSGLKKLRKDFLENRRAALSKYLQSLLKHTDVCKSIEFRMFICHSEITKALYGLSVPEMFFGNKPKKSLFKNILQNVDDSLEKGKLKMGAAAQVVSALPGQLLGFEPSAVFGRAGTHLNMLGIQNLSPSSANSDIISASFSPISVAGLSVAGNLSSSSTAPTVASNSQASAADAFVELFNEIFELGDRGNWLRRQAVSLVAQQLFGGTVERRLTEQLKTFFNEDAIAYHLDAYKESMWPTSNNVSGASKDPATGSDSRKGLQPGGVTSSSKKSTGGPSSSSAVSGVHATPSQAATPTTPSIATPLVAEASTCSQSPFLATPTTGGTTTAPPSTSSTTVPPAFQIRTAEQKAKTKIDAETKLNTLAPELLGGIVGRHNAKRGAQRFIKMFQNQLEPTPPPQVVGDDSPRISTVILPEDAPDMSDKDIKSKQKRQWLFKNDKDVENLLTQLLIPFPCVMRAIALTQCTNNGIQESVYVTRPTSITSLEMCHFNFPTITAVHHFPNLTSLCLVAQDISEIEGLDDCTGLRKLWICEARIRVIKGLDNLINLKELFLYSNRIKKIDGLDKLEKLEKLWLSDNEISRIERLENLKNLKDLQLGNNRIASVGDTLTENVNLAELNIAGNRLSSFRDVLFLARLPKLTSLCLSDPNFADNPLCALCNYQTHVIYHLPNLKCLDTLEVTEESRKIISATVLKKRMYYNMRIRTIKRNTNFLIKLLQTRNAEIEGGFESDINELLKKLKRIHKYRDDLGFPPPHSKDKIEQFSGASEQLEEARVKLNSIIDGKMRTLTSLQKLKREVSNQITQQSDMAIRKLLLELETGGNVRFEDDQRDDSWFDTCESLVKSMILRATASHQHKRVQIHRISRVHNRYLKNKFEQKLRTIKSPDNTQSFEYLCFQVSEGRSDEIFRAVEHGFTNDSTSVRPLSFTNFLEVADSTESNGNTAAGRDRKKLRQAIIVRAFANKVATLDEVKTRLHSGILASDYPSANAVFREINSKPPNGDSCREYFVFDPELVMPEYFVEYSLESDFDRLTTKVEKLMVDIAYSNKLSQADMPTIVVEVTKKMAEKEESSNIFPNNMPLAMIESHYSEIKAVNNLGEVPPPQLTLEILSRRPVNSVESLNLSLITENLSLDPFLQFTSLKSLTLSYCNLIEFPMLRYFPKLETLDISFNNIAVIISGINSLTHLKNLDLQGNQIGTFDTLSSSSKSTWTDIWTEKSSNQPHLFRPLSVRTQFGYGSSAAQNEYWRIIKSPEQGGQGSNFSFEKITVLELDNCNLFDLDQLPLGNNNLRDVTRLASYSRLEELSLENNEIESIDCLTQLTSLTKLDVSNNKVATVDMAGNFKSLMLLSLENNLIKNLKPFAKLTSVMELYIGNNYINDLYSIFPLKELPRLIILDLTGNTVCQTTNYRLFTIFHLSRLKILDGSGIVLKEQQAAKEIYMGKLTIELLGEKIGHFQFRNISELDLRNCKIREIDCFAGGDFRNIRKLNFDNNLISNLDPFLNLPWLRFLSLNNNRVEKLLSTDALQATMGSGYKADFGEVSMGRSKSILGCLEELHLGYNNIAKISDLNLARLPQLRLLYLQGNRITKIEGLEHMTGLVELVLDKNQIKAADPSSFLSLINLKELHIKDNRLKSLSHFDCLPNLQYLFLNGNRIAETSEIEKMKLPNLVELNLISNSVTRKQLYRLSVIMRFPQIMCIDEKDVTDEERQRAEVYYMEQSMMREDQSGMTGSLKMPMSIQAAPLIPMMSAASISKLPIKITSVVLDGLEMKLAANSSGFGSQRQ